MVSSIREFEFEWSQEIEATQKVLKHIKDSSLGFAAFPGGRSVGRLAWHIVQSIPEMAGKTGLPVDGPGEDDPVPASARAIFQAYNTAAISLLDRVKSLWTDATLLEKDSMYGREWARGFTLTVLIKHQIHHRGQLTFLMRTAGLAIPGIYGPTREEWAAWGKPEPAV